MTEPRTLFLPEKRRGPHPVVIILPILGRLAFLPDFWIEKRMARYLASKGIAGAVLERDFFRFRPGGGVEQVNDYLEATAVSAIQLLDELLQRPDLDSSRIGTLGLSFGGMINVLLAARDPRIRAAVIALAAGNIPDLLEVSQDPLVKQYYALLRQGTGLSPDVLHRRLESTLTHDPIHAAGKIDSEKILMIIARRDRVVPFRYADALRKKMGNPETLYLPCGHYLAMLLFPWLRVKALRFFQHRFFLESALR